MKQKMFALLTKAFLSEIFSNIVVAVGINPTFYNNILCSLHMLYDGQVQLKYTIYM